MKKIYQSPQIEVILVESETVIATSPLTATGPNGLNDDDTIDDPIDVKARRRDTSFEDEEAELY